MLSANKGGLEIGGMILRESGKGEGKNEGKQANTGGHWRFSSMLETTISSQQCHAPFI
jgi:hypothetical protein